MKQNIILVIGRLFERFPMLRRAKRAQLLITKLVLWLSTKGVPPRPYPFSQYPDYTSWEGLIDRKISGRHTAFPDPQRTHNVPDEKTLVDMFVRPSGQQGRISARSSLLFAAFAQWFTDSFLRTSHGFEWDQNGNPVIDPVTKRPKRSPLRHAYNDSNHEIDLCQIYGMTAGDATKLRTRNPSQRGFLAYQVINGQMFPCAILDRPNVPPPPSQSPQKLPIHPQFAGLHDERLLRVIFDGVYGDRSAGLFAVGLEHGNATLGNSLFNTLFLREHNRVAKKIGEAYSNWDDDRVFCTTRNVLIVLLLKIVICDYIVHIAPGQLPLTVIPGYAERHRWYRTNRIAIEFNLLYRWHEMVPDQFDFLTAVGAPVQDYQHNNQWIMKPGGVEDMIEALSRQPSGMIVMGNMPWWISGKVAQDTISLMRASRLASYQAYRSRFGFRPAKSFEDVTDDPQRLQRLKDAYPDGIESLEWFVGMYAEDHPDGAIMGPLMQSMVAYDAFTQALTNPLLAGAVYGPQTFSDVGIKVIEETNSLASLVRRNVDPGRADSLICSFDI